MFNDKTNINLNYSSRFYDLYGQVVLWSCRYESVAATVPQAGGEQSQLHGQENHAPLPLPQHLSSQNSV